MPNLRILVCVCSLALACAGAWSADGPYLRNGGFEQVKAYSVEPGGVVNGWTLKAPDAFPDGWTLNTAYPGTLDTVAEGAHSGDRAIRIISPERGTAHLYQVCTGLVAGEWYRVSLWARGGSFIAHFYEYYQGAPIGGTRVLSGTTGADEWRRFEGYYQPSGDNYLRSALAVYPPAGGSVEIDDVSIEKLELPQIDADAPDVTFENPLVKVVITARGSLRSLVDRATGTDYSDGSGLPILRARRGGITVPVQSLSRDGDDLVAQFLDPDVKARLRVTPRERHFRIEVVSVEPDDVEELNVEFPVRRLATIGGAFNATYDDDFAMCMFCTSVNARNLPTYRGAGSVGLRGACYKAHGLTGASFALIGAPRDQFQDAIMEAERQNGLPCPMLGGKWNRVSDAVRKSYLFATGVVERDVDKLIEYAKIGGFGTIIFLKNSWLANHGHFDINTANFPDGVESVKQAVRKIHAAGLDAGVHVFGPSISPNDPYVTPVPDDRLASVSCPPLAEAVSATDTTLTLQAVPTLPPNAPESRAFPGHYVRIGDEIIRYSDDVNAGPPYRLLNCTRGALGTAAAAHPKGAEVKGLLAQWGFFLVDPDSTLADELTQNFADVFNECDFDFVYFDASDGMLYPYIDRWYYLNKMHQGFYRKFKRDVLYQTSNGTGTDLAWHIIPRSASADGHGDIKGYLDDRWPGILHMADNLTKADIGWYYWFRDCFPDQIEYVCAKAMGVDGSISLETSREAIERLSQSRQMFEMIGRWERCRAQRTFGEEVRAKLREPGKEFKLLERDGKWELYRAVYEERRTVDVLNGGQNTWQINNDLNHPCRLGVELVRGVAREGRPSDYYAPGFLTLETFDDASPYAMSERNDYEKFVVGGDKVLSEGGPVRKGVTQAVRTDAEAQEGGSCFIYSAQNDGGPGGWCGIGRRFDQALDLSGYQGVGLWLRGDGNHETIRIQFRDTQGRTADLLPTVNFTGWRLLTFALPKTGFDWSQTEYLLFYFNNISPKSSVEIALDDVRMLPALSALAPLERPSLTVNGSRLEFPVSMGPGQAITCEATQGVHLWPGGMAPAQSVDVSTGALELKPGTNTITLSCASPQDFPGDVRVTLYRMWPMEQ